MVSQQQLGEFQLKKILKNVLIYYYIYIFSISSCDLAIFFVEPTEANCVLSIFGQCK